MFKKLDLWIENKVKQSLYRDRERIIRQAIEQFKNQYPQHNFEEFKTKLDAEIRRIYPIVNRSILRERIQRGKWIFLGAVAVTVIVVGGLIVFTGGSSLAFISPLVNGIASWGINLASIPISYNQRVKGSIDSVFETYQVAPQVPTDKIEIHITLPAVNPELGVFQKEMKVSINKQDLQPAEVERLQLASFFQKMYQLHPKVTEQKPDIPSEVCPSPTLALG